MSSGLDLETEVKPHCQVDFADHDALIAGYLAAAEAHVGNYCRRDFDTDFGDGSWPAPVKTAIQMLVAHYYRNREAVVTGTGAVALPMAVTDLLAAYREFT